jgi:hypothetical protein
MSSMKQKLSPEDLKNVKYAVGFVVILGLVMGIYSIVDSIKNKESVEAPSSTQISNPPTQIDGKPTAEAIGIQMAKCGGVFLGQMAIGFILQVPQKTIDDYQTGVNGASNVAKKILGQDLMVKYMSEEQNKTTQAIKAGRPPVEIANELTIKTQYCTTYFKDNEAQIMQLANQ